MAEIPVVTPGYRAAFYTQSANAGGDYFRNTDATVLYFKNSGGGAINITITPAPIGNLSFAPVVVAVAAGQEKVVGPFDHESFNAVGGNVNVAYSGVSGLVVGAIHLGRTQQDITPTQQWDFLQASTLDGLLITFARSSVATRVKADGMIEVVESDVARLDYDPGTLQARGLLIEEERTNLIAGSSTVGNGNGWSNSWGGGVTLGANAAVAPDGSMTASQLTNIDSIGDGISRNITLTTSKTYAISLFLKNVDATRTTLAIYAASTGNLMLMSTNWSGGVPSLNSATNASNVVYTPYPNGWYRVTFQFASHATETAFSFLCTPENVLIGRSIYVWGAQLELGEFATSYIPTTTAAATRSADVATVTDLGWYNQAEGTFSIKYTLLALKAVATYATGLHQGILQLLSAGAQRVDLMHENNLSGNPLSYEVFNGSTNDVAITILATGTTGPNTVAIAYKANDFAAAGNGAPVQTDVSGAVTARTLMRIGAFQTTDFMNGHVQWLRYYDTRLPNGRIPLLTL